MAPLIAKDAPVKGIIAYGTIGVNFMEYFLNSRRTIAEANRMTPAEADDYVKMNCECAYPYFVQGKSIAEIHRQQPACREVFGDLGRIDVFWKQLYALNIPALWTGLRRQGAGRLGAGRLYLHPRRTRVGGGLRQSRPSGQWHLSGSTGLPTTGCMAPPLLSTRWKTRRKNTTRWWPSLLGKWLLENAGDGGHRQ